VRLLADEHVPPAFVSALRGEGHDVAVVGDELVAGPKTARCSNTPGKPTASF